VRAEEQDARVVARDAVAGRDDVRAGSMPMPALWPLGSVLLEIVLLRIVPAATPTYQMPYV
jgi:hypothetical protein